MMRALLALLMLAGCASAPPDRPQVDEARLLAAAVPGQATISTLRAAFGPATVQRFDSGAEVWLYQAPAGGGRFTELVLQWDRRGILRKVRRRPPHSFDPK